MPSVPGVAGIPSAMLTNFGTGVAAEPGQYQTVMSIRGRTNSHVSRIDNISFNTPQQHRTQMIAIYPDGFALDGDSGGALIRREFSPTERTVMGTRSAAFIHTTGGTNRRIGLYTRISNYRVW